MAKKLLIQSKDMSVSREVWDYFSKLIEPLVTNAGLTGLFERMKEEIEKCETK